MARCGVTTPEHGCKSHRYLYELPNQLEATKRWQGGPATIRSTGPGHFRDLLGLVGSRIAERRRQNAHLQACRSQMAMNVHVSSSVLAGPSARSPGQSACGLRTHLQAGELPQHRSSKAALSPCSKPLT